MPLGVPTCVTMEVRYLLKRHPVFVFVCLTCLFVIIQLCLFLQLRGALDNDKERKRNEKKNSTELPEKKIMDNDRKGSVDELYINHARQAIGEMSTKLIHKQMGLSTTAQCRNFTKPSINPFELDPTSVVQGAEIFVKKNEGYPSCVPPHFRYDGYAFQINLRLLNCYVA